MLAQLAREGKLCTGDTEMAELLTEDPQTSELTDIQVDGVVFARDSSRVRQWGITVRGPRKSEGVPGDTYVGSILFPPEYPSSAPVLIYAERVHALDLCGTIIKNARVMAVSIYT